jgi:hypothetical protein
LIDLNVIGDMIADLANMLLTIPDLLVSLDVNGIMEILTTLANNISAISDLLGPLIKVLNDIISLTTTPSLAGVIQLAKDILALLHSNMSFCGCGENLNLPLAAGDQLQMIFYIRSSEGGGLTIIGGITIPGFELAEGVVAVGNAVACFC